MKTSTPMSEVIGAALRLSSAEKVDRPFRWWDGWVVQRDCDGHR
jgi:hypothetical protein